jgi:hypothetical protein
MPRSRRIDGCRDGAKKPAARAPHGDFFAGDSGRPAAFQSALFSGPERRRCTCFAPLPGQQM